MSMSTYKTMAIVTPVLNDWASFAMLVKDIAKQDSLAAYDITVVAVDDGSAVIEPPPPSSLTGPVKRVIIVELNANQGHQRAIALGLAHVHQTLKPDVVIAMDSDGEDVPSDIGSMMDLSAEKPGTLIVAQRAKRSENIIFKTFYGVYKLAFRLLTGKLISFGNFSLIPADRVPNLIFNSGIWNNFAATMLKSRVPIDFVPTHRGTRYQGESKMNFTSLMIHGFSAISVFTDVVIGRIILGLVGTSVLAALLVCLVVFMKFFTTAFVPGYATNVILFVLTVLALTLFTGFLLVLSLLAGRDKQSALPTDLFGKLVRQIRQIDADTLVEVSAKSSAGA